MRPRKRNGQFKSDCDIAEEEMNAKVRKLMACGMSFNEAWIRAGGDIFPTPGCSPESTAELMKTYAAVGKQPLEIRYKGAKL